MDRRRQYMGLFVSFLLVFIPAASDAQIVTGRITHGPDTIGQRTSDVDNTKRDVRTTSTPYSRGFDSAIQDETTSETYGVAESDTFTIPVVLDGVGTYRFILDTASSRSVIFDHTRASLGIQPDADSSMTIYALVGKQTTPALTLKTLAIGETVLRDVKVASLPDSKYTTDSPIDGILGLDILENYTLFFDTEAQTLHLYANPAELPRRVRNWNWVRLYRQRLDKASCDFWYFGAQLNRSASATLLDLGAGVTIINWPMAESLGVHRSDFTHIDSTEGVKDVFGSSSPVVLLTSLAIRIGEAGWRKQSVVVADYPVFDVLKINEIPASLMGSGLLKNRSFAIDFHGEYLYIEDL